MIDMADLPHLTLDNTKTTHPYTSPGAGGGEKNSPPKPARKTHGQKLLSDLDRATRKAAAQQKSDPTRQGMQFIPLRVDEGSDFELQVQSLENKNLGVRVISSRVRNGVAQFLIGVPNDKIEKFAKKFQAYADESEVTAKGNPKNEPLAIGIEQFDSGDFENYWTDASESLRDTTETVWWEVWLDVFDKDRQEVEEWFRREAGNQNIRVSSEQVLFPDRLVVLAFNSFENWKKFPGLLCHLAEIRKANMVASEFASMTPAVQGDFVDDLVGRTSFAAESSNRITILDEGVDRGHPLLEQSLAADATQTWNEDWGSDDHSGHGTLMAGVCLYGSLSDELKSSDPVSLSHQLESVKILPRKGDNDPPDYGPITTGAMAKAEAVNPNNSRVFCMAVTAPSDDLWRPTLWSASVDQACSGALDGHQRLMVVSAGNIREDTGKDYPDENHVSSVEDPSQAWNVLSVGGYTNLAWMQEEGLEGYTPIARPGTLAPASRTSLCWGDEPWPYKPDVVFEGGNYAKDAAGFITGAEDLQTLTTQSSKFSDSLLGTICDTSGATAEAAYMAAVLQSEYPEYWPETIRGLVVHSAKWTPQMIEQFGHTARRNRLRVYGMGVPDLDRAKRSAQGFTTMVIQDQLQPFKADGSDIVSDEMAMHDLPIPKVVLEDLGSLEVRMRVTLSYFIEPNPPRRGKVAQYQYASHGLRFSVRRPQETPDRMGKRISRSFWDRDAAGKAVRPARGSTVEDDRKWELGERVAVRGSVHSDCWHGTAAQLASSNLIAVYPVTGWWRYRKDPEIHQKKARYSLIVSIETDDKSVDLYEMVKNEVKSRVKMKASTVVVANESI